jgi:REP-associated tyrosine transposase
LEVYLPLDHVHMLISIPPKYTVAQVIDFVKGKGAVHIAKNFIGPRKNFAGQHFGARGYAVSTVGRDEAIIQEYIKKQEQEYRICGQFSILEK